MFRTLYSRIATVLLLLVTLIGYSVYNILLYSAEMYQQELTQKLNTALAQHIVAEEPLLKEQQVNHKALKSLFHWLMVINPSIELYLLDPGGKILAFSAPEGRVKRRQVSLQPIQDFLADATNYPLLGDDPRGPQRQKVFSAAKIPGTEPDNPAGYLYVILEGEAFDSATDRVKGSYILRFATTGLGAGLLLALAAGLTAFALLTRRLHRLSQIMATYGKNNGSTDRYPLNNPPRDEIDQLGATFNRMAERIDQQLKALAQTDAKRREMVANVSHDLRTPLTSLHGYLETLLLKDETLTTKERRQYLEIAAAQSARLNQLISELFELAKLDSSETLLNIEPFSLAELTQDVVHKFHLEADKSGIHIKTLCSKDLPFAYGDIGLIQRALDNLIENALRYTPRGGRITLSLTDQTGKIVVRVTDTGQGIPTDEIDHIFDRFYRLEKNRAANAKNAGLGLAIVKRIIDLHGSDIHTDSEPNQGTTFSFTLPTRQFA
jgi:signal transduction histidine kinase